MASLYAYPKTKKPAVSLAQACTMAATMLKFQGEEARYHVYRTSLLGDEEQTGDGMWTLHCSDGDGNEVWAHIALRGSSCSLAYYPHDYEKKGGVRREVEFERDGANVTGPVKEPGKAK